MRGRKKAELGKQKVTLAVWRQICEIEDAKEKEKGMRLYIEMKSK